MCGNMALRQRVRRALERAAIGEPWHAAAGALCTECVESTVRGCPSCVAWKFTPNLAACDSTGSTHRAVLPAPLTGLVLPAALWVPHDDLSHKGETGWQVVPFLQAAGGMRVRARSQHKNAALCVLLYNGLDYTLI